MAWLLLSYRVSGLRWLLRQSGLLRLLPAPLAALESLAPDVSPGQIAARLPALTPAAGQARARVALLEGCVQAVYFPEVNQATLRVLAAEGCDVVVPSGLGCCGALSGHAGRHEEARALARLAIERLEDLGVDAIVVNAAGCGAAMKHYPRLLADDSAWHGRAEAVAARVRDVSEWLVELGPSAARHPVPVRAAYHDACHLSHGQGVRSQPRALLAGIPGLELCAVPDADQCCGSAGIYNLLEPASADAIGRRKADNLRAAEADLIISANPGCSLQIQKHLAAAGDAVRILHPVELIDASIRGRAP
jgi:glycolate oxidase iron-sulfur subunit